MQKQTIDISLSQTPPLKKEFVQIVDNVSKDKYYKKIIPECGQDYVIRAEVQISIPELRWLMQQLREYKLVGDRWSDLYSQIRITHLSSVCYW